MMQRSKNAEKNDVSLELSMWYDFLYSTFAQVVFKVDFTFGQK